jgi:hypothetical protein
MLMPRSQNTRQILFVLSLFLSVLLCNSSISAQNLAGEDQIAMASPLDYQVFQRESLWEGKVEIRGTIHFPIDRIEASLSGNSLKGPWTSERQRISFNRKSGHFNSLVSAPSGGFYELRLRFIQNGSVVKELIVGHVGIGEVFVIAGQSNSTNYGETPQVSSTGMVSSFSGVSWAIANDPQLGVQDNSNKGSFIPAFGDTLYRKYHVPIGIASVGYGSTSVRQWLPVDDRVMTMPQMTKFILRDADGRLVSDGTLFNGLMARVNQLGKRGFRAVLWHQGESDANQLPEHQISPDTYREMLTRVIDESQRRAGWSFPWFVAEATYHPGQPSDPAIEQAQRSLWESGVAQEGPDTDTLTEAYRQANGKGIHFNSLGLQTHGALWADKVGKYLDSELAQDSGEGKTMDHHHD